MLAVLAAVALVVGGVSTATVVTQDHTGMQGSKEPVVQVQAIQPAAPKPDHVNFVH